MTTLTLVRRPYVEHSYQAVLHVREVERSGLLRVHHYREVVNGDQRRFLVPLVVEDNTLFADGTWSDIPGLLQGWAEDILRHKELAIEGEWHWTDDETGRFGVVSLTDEVF